VFGARYRDVFGTEVPLVVRWQRQLRAGAVLDGVEASQIIRAVRETAYSEVASVAEAFAAVDEGVANQAALWDASNRREYVVYEVGAGDNSFGAFFAAGSVEPAARIVDGDITDCSTTAQKSTSAVLRSAASRATNRSMASGSSARSTLGAEASGRSKTSASS